MPGSWTVVGGSASGVRWTGEQLGKGVDHAQAAVSARVDAKEALDDAGEKLGDAKDAASHEVGT